MWLTAALLGQHPMSPELATKAVDLLGLPASAETTARATERIMAAITAIVLGCVGLLVAGIVFCLVVGFLAAVAGGKAREEGRSLDNAYIAFLLAAVDGVAWIVLHIIFDMHFLFG